MTQNAYRNVPDIVQSEKNNLYKTIEKLTSELEDIKEKYEEVRAAKQEAVRELLTLQEQHKAELRILTNSQMEEANARENLERKLCELRAEVRIGQLFCSFILDPNPFGFSFELNRILYRLFSLSVYKPKMPLNGENENALNQTNWHLSEITKSYAMRFEICRQVELIINKC